MELLVANVDEITFDVEVTLEEQLGSQPLPFPGMDKSMSGVCTFFAAGRCSRGDLCPFRHLRCDRAIVCKHWLRGLCKKGDNCEFLHEYDMSKMPECYFYAKFSSCHNKECPFLHIDPATKVRDCPWYDRGFCRHGPLCRNRHVRRVLCLNYLAGLCPDGKQCTMAHPRFELPRMEDIKPPSKIVCHLCRQPGHKAFQCPNSNTSAAATTTGNSHSHRHNNNSGGGGGGSAHHSYNSHSVNNNNSHSHAHLPNAMGFGKSGNRYEMSGHSDVAPELIMCFKCRKLGHISTNCTEVSTSVSQMSFLAPPPPTPQSSAAMTSACDS